jgi:hypothetical protein
LYREYIAQYYDGSSTEPEDVIVSRGFATPGINARLQQKPKTEATVPVPVSQVHTALPWPVPPTFVYNRTTPELPIWLPRLLSPKALRAMPVKCFFSACHGSISLVIHETTKRGWTPVVLGSAAFSLQKEQVASLTVSLTRAGRARLAHAKRRPVGALMIVSIIGGTTTKSFLRLT